MGYKVKLMTEGSNFPGIWAFSSNVVDLDAISSNDIYAILKTYDVEDAELRSCKKSLVSSVPTKLMSTSVT